MEISERANQLLHDIEARCDLLIEKAKSSHEIMSAAKSSQDELYELYQEVLLLIVWRIVISSFISVLPYQKFPNETFLKL